MTDPQPQDRHSGNTPPDEPTADSMQPASNSALSPVATIAADEVLDRSISFPMPWWVPVTWVALIFTAIALRFAKLSDWALTPDEARNAFLAWNVAIGGPEQLPDSTPTPLLLNALSLFLFGTTDATFRIVSAIAGTVAVVSLLATHRVAGRYGVLGMTALAAISPTLVFASRIHTGQMLVAALTLGIAVTVAWTGSRPPARPTGAATVGVLLGLLIGCGETGVMSLLTLGIALAIAALVIPKGAIRRGLGGIGADTRSLTTTVGTMVLTLLVLYTRLFTDPGALRGLVSTFQDWASMLTAPSVISPTYYLAALVLYESVSVLLAISGAVRGFGKPGNSASDDWLLLLASWFVGSFVLWSFAGGRAPENTVLIALPLVLIAGCALAGLIADTNWADIRHGASGVFALVIIGISMALFSALVLFSADRRLDRTSYGPMLIVVGVVVPLLYVAWQTVRRERLDPHPGQLARVTLLVFALMLAGFGFSTATHLAFERAVLGREMLAQNFTTGSVKPTVEGLRRLSRDVTLDDRSVRDTTGGHGLTVALDPRVEWPWRWYMRDFPNTEIVKQTEAGPVQVIIGPKGDQLRERGYEVREIQAVTGVPESYTSPDLGYLTRFINPLNWIEGARFLHLRDGVYVPQTEPDAIGFDAELAKRINGMPAPAATLPSTSDTPGVASASTFQSPIGIAVAADDTAYSVDAVNGHVFHLDEFGEIIDVWSGGAGPVELFVAGNGLGPTGIAIGPDGLIYIADTWNHRVVVMTSSGDVIREIGGPLNDGGGRSAADNTDDPLAVQSNPGAFFGPRGIAVTADRVYVTDTGNERVQAFDLEGNVVWIFGGYGNGEANLIEPVGIAVGPDGNLYVADSGNQRITVLSAEGSLIRHFPVTAWPAPDPGGSKPFFQPYLAFLPDGRLAVSSSSTGSIELYWPDGTFDQKLKDLDGQALSLPYGVAVDSYGDLWVADASLPGVVIGTVPDPVTSPSADSATPVGS